MNHSWLDFRDRDAIFREIESRCFDVLVIGGGITGAGIARDAALRGLDVVLVEARDFASGTSGRSSKMIHGGLRYLAQGHIALVREAAREREILREIAPHLVRPVPFVLPASSNMAVAKLKMGLWLFEKLAGVARTDRHKIWSLADIRRNEPLLRSNNLSGAVVYSEYLTDDARLTLANIRSAREAGATVVSYAPVKRIIMTSGRASGVEVAAALPGEFAISHIRAKLIVNAAGPWVDAIRSLEDNAVSGRLQLTKGIHLVLPKKILPVCRTVIMATADRRNIFAVPRGDYVYIGTTDTFCDTADYWPEITRGDIDYLFAALVRNFFVKPLKYRDIISVWAGVRPLVAEKGKSPSEISRKDEVWTGSGGILSIAGGKLTAYRKMAERIVSLVEQRLGRQPSACRTASIPLPGDEKITSGDDRFHAEVMRAVRVEGALTLEDYWMRRSSRALFDHGAGIPVLSEAANIMAEFYHWSAVRRDWEIDSCKSLHNNSRAAIDAL